MTKIDLKTGFSIKSRFSWICPPSACSGLITAVAMATAMAMAIAMAMAMAMAMAVAMAMAMAVAMATAMAVIRPEYAEGGQIHENLLFMKKHDFRPILVILDLLDLKNGSGSKFCIGPCRFHVNWSLWSDFMTENVRKSTNTFENVNLYDKKPSIFEHLNILIVLSMYITCIMLNI